MSKRSVFSRKPLVKSSSIRVKLLNQRSIILFHSAIKSEYTKKQYQGYLDKFLKYFIIKDFDSLTKIEPKKLQSMIEDFVIYHKDKQMSFAHIKGFCCSLELFFAMNDIILNWKKIKKMYPEQKKPMGDVPYTTEQIKQILNHTTNIKYRAIINFMSASGVRIGSFEELRVKDLKDFKNGSKSVMVYASSREEYYTFIHSEAIQALEDYFEYRRTKGEIITPDSWVFPLESNHAEPIKAQSMISGLSRLVTKVLNRKSPNKRFDTMTSHGFRKRFATVLKSNREINLSISEKLLGHSTSVKLDNVYFKPVIEQLYDEYEKAIPELAIYDELRLKIELEKKNNQLSSLEVKDRRIEDLENALFRIENNMNELKSRF